MSINGMSVPPVNKGEHRRLFWDDWAAKADKSGQHVRFMLGIDDFNEAVFLSENDVSEVIGLLPDLTGMEVLELASGVGRFTPDLAKRAKHVTSTDFTESFVEENRHANAAKYPNITFRTLDATKLDYPPDSFDCVFFTWLLAYLANDEVQKCVENLLRIIRPGGYLFFRETHYTCACSCDTTNNAGVYRSLKEFRNYFKPTQITDQNGDAYYFEHVFCINSRTYTKYKNMPTLINYLWKKSKVSNDRPDKKQDLDNIIYNEECIQIYDHVVADGFCTPGGLEAAKKWLSHCNVKPGSLVLDVGSGMGGLQTLLMKEYDSDVTSVDISMLACEAAILRLVDLQKNKGCVTVADLSIASFPQDSFDFIMVKETLEFMDKCDGLFDKFWQWLKPNGWLLIGGYFQGNGGNGRTPELAMKDTLYLTSEKDLSSDLLSSGFTQVSSVDLTSDFIHFLDTDLKKLEKLEDVSCENKKRFSQLWSGLLSGLKTGEVQWRALSATCNSKPHVAE